MEEVVMPIENVAGLPADWTPKVPEFDEQEQQGVIADLMKACKTIQLMNKKSKRFRMYEHHVRSGKVAGQQFDVSDMLESQAVLLAEGNTVRISHTGRVLSEQAEELHWQTLSSIINSKEREYKKKYYSKEMVLNDVQNGIGLAFEDLSAFSLAELKELFVEDATAATFKRNPVFLVDADTHGYLKVLPFAFNRHSETLLAHREAVKTPKNVELYDGAALGYTFAISIVTSCVVSSQQTLQRMSISFTDGDKDTRCKCAEPRTNLSLRTGSKFPSLTRQERRAILSKDLMRG